MKSTELIIKHDPDHLVFYNELKTGVAYLKYKRSADDVLNYQETYVPEASRHSGIASKLVKQALDFALENGYRVIPSCPFVAHFMDRHHPEYNQALFIKKTKSGPEIIK